METPMTHPLTAVVNERFGGVLTNGKHDPNGRACLLEAVSIARGLDWSPNYDRKIDREWAEAIAAEYAHLRGTTP